MTSPNGIGHAESGPLIVEHRGRAIYLPPVARLLMNARQQRERTKLLAGRYFLVNMRDGIGEIFRCGRCNGKHDRLTKYCIERPFSGLYGGLYGYTQTVKDAEAAGRLGPDAQARLDRIRRLFRATDGLPDLASSHPDLARRLSAEVTTGPLNALDLDVGIVSLGLLERIDQRDAQNLLDRINTRATAFGSPVLVVPGLRGPSI